MNINTITTAVHENAVAHGWWENERTFGELIALCHSELSEALEEHRKGKAVWEIYYTYTDEFGIVHTYSNNPKGEFKPEGIPMELADTVIRLMDICGHYEIELPRAELKNMPVYKNIGDFISDCHVWLSSIYITFEGVPCMETIDILVSLIVDYCETNGIDFERAILEKHEFNKSRPYKHGGKVL